MAEQFYTDAANVFTGVIGEGDVNTSKQVRDVDRMMTLVTPDNRKSPLVVGLTAAWNGLKHKDPATNVKHEWARKKLMPRWDTVASVSSGNGTSAITFTPTNLAYYRVGDEIVFYGGSGSFTHAVVTAKTSTIVATAIDGSTSLPTIAAGNAIQILSDSSEGWSQMPTPKQVKQEYEWNYPQYLRYPTQIDIWELGMKQYTGPERNERIAEQRRETLMSAERIIFFGERATRAGTNGSQYFARGCQKYIENVGSSNTLDWSGGSLSQSTFDDWYMEGPGKFGSGEKLFYVSVDLLMKMHEWNDTKERINIGGGDTHSLGVVYTRYKAPNGNVLKFFQHHMLTDEYAGAGFIIDPAYTRLKGYGSNPMFSFHQGIQENDRAGEANEWRALFTLQCSLPEADGYIHQ